MPAAHPCLVSSAMKLITPGVVELVNMANDGAFPGGNYFGKADLAPFHDFDDMIPQELKDLLEATQSRPDRWLDRHRVWQLIHLESESVNSPFAELDRDWVGEKLH